MGTWNLERLTTHSSPMNAPFFGNNYHAVFHLKYTTSGAYTETPRLDWHETIMLNDYQNHQSWVFDTNMYTHNPGSNTLIVWTRRYIEAYRSTAHMPPGVQKGKAELRTRDGQPVAINDLGANLVNENQQADAVRAYLRHNGGLLVIEIHDVPGMGTPTAGQHKERLLMFNVGVEGQALKSKAEQYLNVQFGVLPANWQRDFNTNGWTRAGLKTTGLATVPAPVHVSAPTPPVFVPGEYW